MGSDDGERRRLRKQITAAERAIVVVAGPNGAGKTTFVETFLHPTGLRVINADAIALALLPDAPGEVAYEAARAAEVVRRDLMSRGISFCMETVFSDPEGAKVAFLREAQERGYVIVLVFIGLESGELAIARVIERTERGGHDVPDEKIVARFPRSFTNLTDALTFVDHAFLFDNSSIESPYRFVAEFRAGRIVRRGTLRPRWWGLVRR
jgi:predicted ABC-type ATPase